MKVCDFLNSPFLHQSTVRAGKNGLQNEISYFVTSSALNMITSPVWGAIYLHDEESISNETVDKICGSRAACFVVSSETAISDYAIEAFDRADIPLVSLPSNIGTASFIKRLLISESWAVFSETREEDWLRALITGGISGSDEGASIKFGYSRDHSYFCLVLAIKKWGTSDLFQRDIELMNAYNIIRQELMFQGVKTLSFHAEDEVVAFIPWYADPTSKQHELRDKIKSVAELIKKASTTTKWSIVVGPRAGHLGVLYELSRDHQRAQHHRALGRARKRELLRRLVPAHAPAQGAVSKALRVHVSDALTHLG